MRAKFFIVLCCVLLLFSNSIVFAGDQETEVLNSEESSQIAITDTQNTNLQKWLEGITPAAGIDFVEKPRKVNYWEQKVIRRNRRGVTK